MTFLLLQKIIPIYAFINCSVWTRIWPFTCMCFMMIPIHICRHPPREYKVLIYVVNQPSRYVRYPGNLSVYVMLLSVRHILINV